MSSTLEPMPIDDNGLAIIDPGMDQPAQRILIVDDEQAIRIMITAFLEDKYICKTAVSCDEA